MYFCIELTKCDWAHVGTAKTEWPGLVASVFAKIEHSLNGAKWRGKLPFDQNIKWTVCGIVFELCDCYFHHMNVSYLMEKAELTVLNYCAARTRALGC